MKRNYCIDTIDIRNEVRDAVDSIFKDFKIADRVYRAIMNRLEDFLYDCEVMDEVED